MLLTESKSQKPLSQAREYFKPNEATWQPGDSPLCLQQCSPEGDLKAVSTHRLSVEGTEFWVQKQWAVGKTRDAFRLLFCAKICRGSSNNPVVQSSTG